MITALIHYTIIGSCKAEGKNYLLTFISSPLATSIPLYTPELYHCLKIPMLLTRVLLSLHRTIWFNFNTDHCRIHVML